MQLQLCCAFLIRFAVCDLHSRFEKSKGTLVEETSRIHILKLIHLISFQVFVSVIIETNPETANIKVVLVSTLFFPAMIDVCSFCLSLQTSIDPVDAH